MQKIIMNIQEFEESINLVRDKYEDNPIFNHYCQFHSNYWGNNKITFDYDDLDIIDRGQSKEIRRINERYVAIKYIPSLSSHTYSRFGIIEGTDSLRMDMTTELFTYLQMQNIETLFVTRYKDFLVFKNLINPPMIEVIFKYFHSGTPVWRYHNIDKVKGRKGFKITKNISYPVSPIIRFDWRNPANKDFKIPDERVGELHSLLKDTMSISKTEDGHYLKINQDQEPVYKQLLKEHRDSLGEELYTLLNEKHYMHDEVMPEDLADYFIDVTKAKKLAKQVVEKLKDIFGMSGYELWDGCINITDDGASLYGELSFDCMRIKEKVEGESQIHSFDKDLWRNGEKQSLITERYTQLVSNIQKSIGSLIPLQQI